MPAQPTKWIGGRVDVPGIVTEGEPFRPTMILWFEVDTGLVVAAQVEDRNEVRDFGESLLEVTRSPAVGAPRVPQRVRVSDERLAQQVRAAAPEIGVEVGPTPEIDEVLQALREKACEEGAEQTSYLEDGRLTTGEIDRLFLAARMLFRAAPWKTASDSQVIRLDMPSLGIEGACVSIIGEMGVARGFAVFPSIEHFDRFVERSDRLDEVPVDLGTSYLSLDFNTGADLPKELRKEVAKHGWVLAAADAYPHVLHLTRDAMVLPLSRREISLVTEVAYALPTFVLKHSDLFFDDAWEAASETFETNKGPEVRLTYPYDASELFEGEADVDADPRRHGDADPRRHGDADPRRHGDADPRRHGDAGVPEPVSVPKVGRNDPCPCGSGKKYKKCHLDQDRKSRSASPARYGFYDLSMLQLSEIHTYLVDRFGPKWHGQPAWTFEDKQCLPFSFVWSPYHLEVEGNAATDWLLRDPMLEIPRRDKELIKAERSSWVGIWEVVGLRSGEWQLVDWLSGQERQAQDRVTVERDDRLGYFMLARVVDFEGRSYVSGSHAILLAPDGAREVVERVRKYLRRKGSIPVEKLREGSVGKYALKRWRDAVAVVMNEDDQE